MGACNVAVAIMRVLALGWKLMKLDFKEPMIEKAGLFGKVLI